MSTPKDSIESSRSPNSPSRAASISFAYGALGQGFALAPVVEVQLELASGSRMPMSMLPDSGASFTVFPRKWAVQLGFDLRECEEIRVDTGGGQTHHWLAPSSMRAWVAEREIALTPCFSDIGVPVLGRGDFFSEFYVEVDERRRMVTITPHDEMDRPEPDVAADPS